MSYAPISTRLFDDTSKTLAECALDREIDDREVKFIKQLHRFLKTLGWAP
jgi:hypothetical protein